MTDCTRLLAIDCAGRAANRAAAILHRDVERGIRSLKAITCLAPLLGAFGTAVSVINALKIYYLMSAFDRGETAGSAEGPLILIAISLPVAILACCGWHLLTHRVAILDLEMRTATLDLLNHLGRCRQARG